MTAAATTAVSGRFLLPRCAPAEPPDSGYPRPRCRAVAGRRCPPGCVAGERVENPCSSSPSSCSERHRSTDGSRPFASCGRRIFFLAASPLLISGQGSSVFFSANAAQEEVEPDESSSLRAEIRKVLSKAKAAGVLRLAFHDAGTFDMGDGAGGMNGSIVLELDRPENAGLNRSVKVLGKAKGELDNSLSTSWADLIAVAGAEAVALCGGPFIPLELGRMDASVADPQGRLPEETLGAAALKKCFSEKGFSTQELVALSGAHTLGSKGFGSPIVFDNAYYKILLERPWAATPSGAGASAMSSMIGLPSDRALAEDTECLRWITLYAADQARFFQDFKSAYVKLVNTGATWRPA